MTGLDKNKFFERIFMLCIFEWIFAIETVLLAVSTVLLLCWKHFQ